MSENEMLWIEQALQGDDLAFGNLVDAFQNPVYNLCYRMLGDAGDAEDAAQESFIKAYRNLRSYDPTRSFITWLLSIASHHCIDRLRKKRLPTFSTDLLPEEAVMDYDTPNPEKEFLRGEEKSRIQTMLNDLDPRDRTAIIMRYWQDCSEVEIAEALSISVSAVKSRLFRSRRQLAQIWQAQQAPAYAAERRPHESPAL